MFDPTKSLCFTPPQFMFDHRFNPDSHRRCESAQLQTMTTPKGWKVRGLKRVMILSVCLFTEFMKRINARSRDGDVCEW